MTKSSALYKQTVTIAMTGASGAQYGLRLLEVLVQHQVQVFFMISKAAQVVVATETDWKLPGKPDVLAEYFQQRFQAKQGQIQVFGREQWMAPVASGSGAPSQMVVCPCSTGTLSAIATGASNNLIERAADVALKERRQLILVPRETPYSAIHLEHMLKLTQLGVTILPASPGFYQKPQSIDDMVDFVVARILNQLGIDHQLLPRWGE
ncbi:UbiX family flavin prenyltransferase [Endozoicomonas sp. SM1973]|uniref:Flavin prenyltransferase UbiX n=1 Tax=Spartinivicinus marinus TaxID=2994442 RepID=A0A853I3F9_9GAMM|nr:flavin prenyltransferase UbiX [Spartinivicinus marinus]MCX4026023.1 UbiX family flavin prenyltransferase [Spartinivicinus marinus]NYZ67923.1 UbiX family flavin prenyltransferase [Spartinivicinus marinus]